MYTLKKNTNLRIFTFYIFTFYNTDDAYSKCLKEYFICMLNFVFIFNRFQLKIIQRNVLVIEIL